MTPPPRGCGAAADGTGMVTSGTPAEVSFTPQPPRPQDQVCAACGAAGQPPTIGEPQTHRLDRPGLSGPPTAAVPTVPHGRRPRPRHPEAATMNRRDIAQYVRRVPAEPYNASRTLPALRRHRVPSRSRLRSCCKKQPPPPHGHGAAAQATGYHSHPDTGGLRACRSPPGREPPDQGTRRRSLSRQKPGQRGASYYDASTMNARPPADKTSTERSSPTAVLRGGRDT